MATAAVTNQLSCVQPGMRLFTAADLAALPEQLPSGPVSFELHHGRLVPMSPTGARHGNLQSRLAAALINMGEMKGHGRAYTEVGIILDRSPDHVLGPDAAFVMARSLPANISTEGYLDAIPELIIEIRSKNDTATEIAAKVADYLQAGVQLVWIVDPVAGSVTEQRPNSTPKILSGADALHCEDIIPSFRLALGELFRD